MGYEQQIIAEIGQDMAALGLSEVKLCELAGINRSTWWRWKNGEVSPTLRQLTNVREALDAERQRQAATRKQ